MASILLERGCTSIIHKTAKRRTSAQNIARGKHLENMAAKAQQVVLHTFNRTRPTALFADTAWRPPHSCSKKACLTWILVQLYKASPHTCKQMIVACSAVFQRNSVLQCRRKAAPYTMVSPQTKTCRPGPKGVNERPI